MKVYIKQRLKYNHYQYFMQQFVASCIKNGFLLAKDYSYLPLFIIKKTETVYLLMRKWFPWTIRRKKAIIVTTSGDTIFKDCFPYFFNSEVIPMLWDVWPNRWNGIKYYLQSFDVKICFVTVKSVAKKIENELGIRSIWIPEGIDTSIFDGGDILVNREIDVFELGRQKKDYHEMLKRLNSAGKLKNLKYSIFREDGNYELAFPNQESLSEGLKNTKIVISFPRTDTHPQQAEGMETLTQRYWECMLSRNLIIGRAPLELIELIGYNPVINVEDCPEQQILETLNYIEKFQWLVDKNYAIAKRFASWDIRTKKISELLQKPVNLIKSSSL